MVLGSSPAEFILLNEAEKTPEPRKLKRSLFLLLALGRGKQRLLNEALCMYGNL